MSDNESEVSECQEHDCEVCPICEVCLECQGCGNSRCCMTGEAWYKDSEDRSVDGDGDLIDDNGDKISLTPREKLMKDLERVVEKFIKETLDPLTKKFEEELKKMVREIKD